MNKELLEFPVIIYGKTEQYNQVLTKARARIFYKMVTVMALLLKMNLLSSWYLLFIMYL